jgi:hypothetical protein
MQLDLGIDDCIHFSTHPLVELTPNCLPKIIFYMYNQKFTRLVILVFWSTMIRTASPTHPADDLALCLSELMLCPSQPSAPLHIYPNGPDVACPGDVALVRMPVAALCFVCICLVCLCVYLVCVCVGGPTWPCSGL